MEKKIAEEKWDDDFDFNVKPPRNNTETSRKSETFKSNNFLKSLIDQNLELQLPIYTDSASTTMKKTLFSYSAEADADEGNDDNDVEEESEHVNSEYEDEEGDWDTDLVLDDYNERDESNHGYDARFGSIADLQSDVIDGYNIENPFFGVANGQTDGIPRNYSLPRESLLEYLETTVCSTVITENSSNGSDRKGTMSSNSPLRAYLADEEIRSLETVNQHLKGIFDWIGGATSTLDTVINEGNCNEFCNARQILQLDIDGGKSGGDYDATKLLTFCEDQTLIDHSNFESIAQSLEVIAQWLRAICCTDCTDRVSDLISPADRLSDKHADTNNSSNKSSSSMSNKDENAFYCDGSKPEINEFASLFGPLSSITMDSFIVRCEAVLVRLKRLLSDEVSDTIKALTQELDNMKLSDGTATQGSIDIERCITGNDNSENCSSRKASITATVEILFGKLVLLLSVFRLKIHFVELSIHTGRFSADSEHFESTKPDDGSLCVNFLTMDVSEATRCSGYSVGVGLLHSIHEELESVLCNWTRMLYVFLTPIQAEITAENLFVSGQVFGKLSESEITAQRRLQLDTTNPCITTSMLNQKHCEKVVKLVVDLQALCVANAMLLVCEKSPITLLHCAAQRSSAKRIKSDKSHYDLSEEPKIEKPVIKRARPLSRYFTSLSGRRSKEEIGNQELMHLKGTKQPVFQSIPSPKQQMHSYDHPPWHYDVSFEILLGSLFVRYMTLIPSPSVVRARLSIASHHYLSCLYNEKLPWQIPQSFQLVCTDVNRKHTDSTLIDNEIHRKHVSCRAEDVEKNIVFSFSEAFGSSLDEPRTLQLLLYEAAVDVLPINHSSLLSHNSSQDPHASRHPQFKKSSFHKSVFHLNNNNNSTTTNASNTSTDQCTDFAHVAHDFGGKPATMDEEMQFDGVVFTDGTANAQSQSQIFQHISPALNLGLPIFRPFYVAEVTKQQQRSSFDLFNNKNSEKVASKTALRHNSVSGAMENEVHNRSFFKHFSASQSNVFPSSGTNAGLSLCGSLRYELFNFTFEIVSSLAQSISEISPAALLGLYRLCALLLAHLNRPDELHRYHRNAAILAVKLGHHESAIMHGKAVHNNILRGTVSNVQIDTNSESHFCELMYVTDLVSEQYYENAQHELAIVTLFSTIHFINYKKQGKHKVFTTNQHHMFDPAAGAKRSGHHRNETWSGDVSSKERLVYTQTEFEQAIFPSLLRAGSLFLEMGSAAKAADIFQVLLSCLTDRMDCLVNDERKVAVLSWIAECYLSMDDFETSHRVVRAIKEVRRSKIDKVTTPVPPVNSVGASDGVAVANMKPMLGIALPSPAFADNCETPVGPNAEDRDFLTKQTQQQQQQRLTSPPHSSNTRGKRFFGSLNTDQAVASAAVKDTVDSQQARAKNYSQNQNLSSQQSYNSATSGLPVLNRSSSLNLKYMLNSKESALPKTCITTYNTDLGDIISRIYFQNKQYVQALKSITPTIIGVELMLGIQDQHGNISLSNTNRDGLLELGKLYYLRGKIQLEASKCCAKIKYPFDVGSAQLFTAIQLITFDIKKSKLATTTKKLFTRGKMSDSAPAQHSSTGMGGSLHNTSFSSFSERGLLRTDSMHSSGGDTAQSKVCGASGRRLASGNNLTCRRTMTYCSPSDLLWDAMKWFRRSWDLFHMCGDEVSAAKSANYIATCHLTPTFSPIAFFGVSLTKASNLSTVTEGVHSQSGTSLVASDKLLSRKPDGRPLSLKSSRPNSFRVTNKTEAAALLNYNNGHGKSGHLTSSGHSYVLNSSKSNEECMVDENSQKVLRPVSSRSSTSGFDSKKDLQNAENMHNSPFLTTSGDSSLKLRPHSGRSLNGNLNKEMMPFLSTRSSSGSSLVFTNIRSHDSNDEQHHITRGTAVGGGYRNNESLASISETVDAEINIHQNLRSSSSGATNNSPAAPAGVTPRSNHHFQQYSILHRYASLEEVQRVMQFSLEISLESCLPLVIIEAYVNLAELYVLQDNKQEGLAYWWEARELFLHLFCDGALLPMLRISSLRYAQKMSAVCNRMVRFLWTCDRAVINQNLFLLDTNLIISNETARIAKRMVRHSSQVLKSLESVLQSFVEVPILRLPKSRLSLRASVGEKHPDASQRIRSFLRTGSSELLRPVVDSSQRRTAPELVNQLIERHGFRLDSHNEEIFNEMTKENVTEKLFDFSWRNYLDYDVDPAAEPSHVGMEGLKTVSPRDSLSPQSSTKSKSSTIISRSNSQDLGPKQDQQVQHHHNYLQQHHRRSVSTESSLSKQLFSGVLSRKPSRSTLECQVSTPITANGVETVTNSFAKNEMIRAMSRDKYKYGGLPDALHKFVLVRGDLLVDHDADQVEPVDQEIPTENSPMETTDPQSAVDTPTTDVSATCGSGGLRNIANVSIVISKPVVVNYTIGKSSHSEGLNASLCNTDSSSSKCEPTSDPLIRQRTSVWLREQPLDPFTDFLWMDHSYASHFSESLLKPALVKPDFDANSLLSEVLRNGGLRPIGSLSGHNPMETMAAVDARAETILIQRLWRCSLMMLSAQRKYQAKRHSMDVLRHSVRSSLRNLSLFMYRIRAFSRQYKGQMTEYDELVSTLGLGCESPTDGHKYDVGIGNKAYIGDIGSVEDVDLSLPSVVENKERISRRAVSLFHRLPHIVYAFHIDGLLLLYRPHDGAQNVQLFGGNGFLLYSTIDRGSLAPPSTIKSSSRSPRKKYKGELAITLNTPRVNSFTLSNKLHSFSSFMLPYVSSSGDDTPPHHLSVETTQRHSPLGGLRNCSDEISRSENSLPRKDSTGLKLGKDSRPPLAGGRFTFDRTLSGNASNSSVGSQTVDPTVASIFPVSKQKSIRKTSSGLQSMGEDSLACSSSSGSVDPQGKHGRQQVSSSAEDINRIATTVTPRSLTHKIDSLMSMLSGSSFSRMSSMESILGNNNAHTNERDKGYDSKSSSGSDLLGPVTAVMPPLSNFSPNLNSNLSKDDVLLLRDLCIQDSDILCAGGKVARQTQFLKMSQGVLVETVKFLRSSAPSLAEIEHVALEFDNEFVEHDEQSAQTSTSSLFGRVSSWQRRTGRGNSTSLSTISTTTGNSFRHGISGLSRASSSGDTDTTQVPVHSQSSRSLLGGMFNMFHQSTTDLMAGSAHGTDKSEHNQSFTSENRGAAKVARPPLQSVPLTLLCSRGLQCLPWEMMLSDCSVVRGLSVLSLCSQSFDRNHSRTHGRMTKPNALLIPNTVEIPGRPPLATPKNSLRTSRLLREESLPAGIVQQASAMRGHLGPGWDQKHAFVAFASSTSRQLSFLKTNSVVSFDVNHRIRSAQMALSLLNVKNDLFLEDIFSKNSPTENETETDISSNVELPITSPLILNAIKARSTSGDSFSKIARQMDLTIIEVYPDNSVSSLSQFMSLVEAKLRCAVADTEKNPVFPIFLLSYADMLDSCECIQYLASRRHDAVLIFAPQFVIELLAVEIKIALTRWCRPTTIVADNDTKLQEPKELKRASSSGFLRGLRSVPSFLRGSSGGSAFNSSETSVSVVDPAEEKFSVPVLIDEHSQDQDISTLPAETKIPILHETLSSHSIGSMAGSVTDHRDSLNQRNYRSSNSNRSTETRRAAYLPPLSPSSSNSTSFYSSSGSGNHDVSLLQDAKGAVEYGPTSSNIDGVHSVTTHHSTRRIPGHPHNPALSKTTALDTSEQHSGSKTVDNTARVRRTRKSVRAKDRTWVYHALLAVVNQTQQEHAVPIAVFI